jgi:acyl-CoA reductase-like NAD-dependent aldehyde dehydrogenase
MFLWRNVISEALMLNGAPSGTVNLIIGDSKKLIAEWMDSPYLNDIFFFGESALGLEIGAQAFAKGKKPILELSGNDMLIVWRDANLTQAAESLLDSFLGSTQICMVPKKALIHGDVYEEFERIFIDKVRNLIVSLPSDPSTYLAPVLRSERFFEFLDDALINGARLLCGGERIDHEGNNRKHGMYIAPTVIRVDEETANTLKCIREENFFPLIPLVRINTDATFRDEHVFQRMMSFIEANHYGLRISVWANSPRYIRKFVANVDNCGLLRINSRHVGFSSLLGTHGGTRFSGGPYGEMNYVWEKTSHLQGISYTKERNGKGNPWMKS